VLLKRELLLLQAERASISKACEDIQVRKDPALPFHYDLLFTPLQFSFLFSLLPMVRMRPRG